MALCAVMVVLAAVLPHFLHQRYWIHTALNALLVILSYALATAADSANDNNSAPFIERFADVSPGAILALIGTGVAFPHRVDADGEGGDEKVSPP